MSTVGQVICDPEDAAKLALYTWGKNSEGRVQAWVDGRCLRLHKLVAPHISFCDHKNGNHWDVRKDNLREATQQQNNWNTACRKDSSTGYKGVHPRKNKNGTTSYRAKIKKDHQTTWLGTYDTPEQAAVAYNKAAIKMFGEFARLNEVEL